MNNNEITLLHTNNKGAKSVFELARSLKYTNKKAGTEFFDITFKDFLYLPSIFFTSKEKMFFDEKELLSYDLTGIMISSELFLADEIQHKLYKKLDKYIPNVKRNILNNNTRQNITNAFGREDEYADKYTKITIIYPLLLNYTRHLSPKYQNCVFRTHFKGFAKDRSDSFDYFIFSSEAASKLVSFDDFFNDFYKIEQSFLFLKKDIKNISNLFFDFIDNENISVNYLYSLNFEYSIEKEKILSFLI